MADNNLDAAVAKAIEFDSTYPPATAQESGATFGAPGTSLQQLVTRTLQGVLGRSFKPDDPESFKAALNVSFETQEVSGRSVFKHIARAYPAVGATDLGAGISGAQYSLVTFAKALHEQTRPLLKNLRSLNSSVDEEDLEATKAIFITAWDEFIGELSREGGPRTSRANDLAARILNDKGEAGHLVELGTQLGVVIKRSDGKQDFDRSKVVTSEEEGYLTNFIALSDYFVAVSQAWNRYRDLFLGKDLGSGLLLLERALSVVEDSVNEVYRAMDSVNIGQAERLIITIGFAAPDQHLTVEDLLSWICSFAGQEAPTLIRDGGVRGVRAITVTSKKLEQLTGSFIGRIRAIKPPQQTGSASTSADGTASLPLPEQLNHARVTHPLGELQRYLTELVRLAEAIAPEPPAGTPSTSPNPPAPGPATPPTGNTPPTGSNTPPKDSPPAEPSKSKSELTTPKGK